jgi:hypothetical protein
MLVLSGPSTTWSMPAPTRSPLRFVRCTSSPRRSSALCCSDSSGSESTAAARGSSLGAGICSLATSSDCTTTCAAPSTGTTSYSMATIDRYAKETSRVERTSTVRLAGEVHRVVRRSTPCRRSSSRSCDCTCPYRRSNGSSSTSSRISLPLVTLMTDCPDGGYPYPASAYGSGCSS